MNNLLIYHIDHFYSQEDMEDMMARFEVILPDKLIVRDFIERTFEVTVTPEVLQKILMGELTINNPSSNQIRVRIGT